MTTIPTTKATTPPGFRVPAAPNSKLEQLLLMYDEAKATADAATARAEDLKASIKAALGAVAPEGTTRISADAPALGLAYEMKWIEKTDLDTKRMKVEDPVTYAKWARKGGYWELRKAAP